MGWIHGAPFPRIHHCHLNSEKMGNGKKEAVAEDLFAQQKEKRKFVLYFSAADARALFLEMIPVYCWYKE